VDLKVSRDKDEKEKEETYPAEFCKWLMRDCAIDVNFEEIIIKGYEYDEQANLNAFTLSESYSYWCNKIKTK
jgi:hypothetical protein